MIARPAHACLLADRLRAVAPHLSEEEIQLYAHGNMRPESIPFELLAATPCVNGRADIFTCDGVDLMGHLNLSEIGGGGGNDLWGWTDPVTGAEIAIIGRTNGTSFIDISDPESPVYLGNLPSHSGSSSWRDIKTFADHAFIVADRQPHGIQVFDLTQLRGVTNPPATFGATAHYGEIGSAHNIVINEDTGFAYAVGSDTCSGGLYMVDVNTPANPTFAGCFSADGYTHDAQCVIYSGPDSQHSGREICFASNEDTLTIVDVTSKSNPVQLSRTGYTQPGDNHYAHQGWLTEDQRYFIFDDEFDELGQGHNTRTYVWDVSNIDAPVLAGFSDAAGSSIDHNQYVRGNFTYQANYARGLRILELDDLANAGLTEVGFFDTHPESNGNSFNGAWSTYPFFASGIVVVSDINRGLFILRPQTPASGCSVEVDFEGGAAGWTNSAASTCATGSFVIGSPTEVTNGGVTTQVEGDHTTGTGNAFFSAVNTAAGTDDVDGGTCIVESPIYAVAESSDVAAWTFHGQRDGGDDSGDSFALEISTDGGSTYAPLASIGDVVTNAAWTRAATTVAAGADVRFRLRVADGTADGDLIEAGIDDVSICPSGASNTAPNVSITAPADGATFTAGGAVTFSGTADDAEDGPISIALGWTSSLDGAIGSGASFSTSALSVGSHTVTASVTDSGGLSAQDQITVTVTPPPTGDCLHDVDFESGSGGWTAGADTCATGAFVVGAPDATDWQVGGGNPGSSLFTAPNPGGVGTDDVDGGTCETLSPIVDASSHDAVEISLDFFHGQRDAGDDAGDGFTIEVLDNGSVVDTLVAIGDVTHSAAWSSVSTVVGNPGNLRLRVRAADAPSTGDVVEGGIDNVSICPVSIQPPACSVEVDFENGAAGWVNSPSSTCSTGSFVVATPTSVVNGGVTTQPAGDHTTGTGNAFFSAVNTSAGADDVDGGTCLVESPVYTVNEASTASLWYFHGQRDAGGDAGDGFALEISFDGGTTYASVASFGDVTVDAEWIEATVSVPAGAGVRFRLQVSDGPGGGDLIEAGLDDLSICSQ